MASFEGKFVFSSNSMVEHEKSMYPHVDDYGNPVWPAAPKGVVNQQGSSRSLKKDAYFQFPFKSEDSLDGGYDSGNDASNLALGHRPSEVNMMNLLTGLIAILTGRSGSPIASASRQQPNSNVSFLESGKNGDGDLHSSVYIPSAPPLLEPTGINYGAYKEVLEADQPE